MFEKWVIPVTQKYRITSDAKMHSQRSNLIGIDFVSLVDKKLISCCSGVVLYVNDWYNPANARNTNHLDSLGRFLVVKTQVSGLSVWLRYCHNEQVDVKVGQSIRAGEIIGKYGYTGFCDPFGVPEGAHVHLDAWVMPSQIEESISNGFIPHTITAPGRWPGGHEVVNTDPTMFLTHQGLDVVKDI